MNDFSSDNVASKCQVFTDEIRKWKSSEIKLRVMFSPDDEIDLTFSDQCLGHQFSARFEADCFRLIAALRVAKQLDVASGPHQDFRNVATFLRDNLTPVATKRHLAQPEEFRTTHATVIPFEEAYFNFDRSRATPMDELLLVLTHVSNMLPKEESNPVTTVPDEIEAVGIDADWKKKLAIATDSVPDEYRDKNSKLFNGPLEGNGTELAKAIFPREAGRRSTIVKHHGKKIFARELSAKRMEVFFRTRDEFTKAKTAVEKVRKDSSSETLESQQH